MSSANNFSQGWESLSLSKDGGGLAAAALLPSGPSMYGCTALLAGSITFAVFHFAGAYSMARGAHNINRIVAKE